VCKETLKGNTDLKQKNRVITERDSKVVTLEGKGPEGEKVTLGELARGNEVEEGMGGGRKT